jgi:hypothetical protein
MYRSTFSWPRHQFEVSGQLHAPAALPLGKSSRYPLYRRLGGPQSLSHTRHYFKMWSIETTDRQEVTERNRANKQYVLLPWLIFFSPKTLLGKALCLRARWHDIRSTFRGTIMVSRDEPAVSEGPELGDETQSVTKLDKSPGCAMTQRNQLYRDFLFWRRYFLGAWWAWWSLSLHTEDPNFQLSFPMTTLLRHIFILILV